MNLFKKRLADAESKLEQAAALMKAAGLNLDNVLEASAKDGTNLVESALEHKRALGYELGFNEGKAEGAASAEISDEELAAIEAQAQLKLLTDCGVELEDGATPEDAIAEFVGENYLMGAALEELGIDDLEAFCDDDGEVDAARMTAHKRSLAAPFLAELGFDIDDPQGPAEQPAGDPARPQHQELKGRERAIAFWREQGFEA